MPDVAGLASQFNVSKATAYTWIHRGYFKARKIGKLRVEQLDIDEVMVIGGRIAEGLDVRYYPKLVHIFKETGEIDASPIRSTTRHSTSSVDCL